MRNRVTRALALVVGSVLAVGIIGAAAVLIVDTIRTGDGRPEPCAGVLERGRAESCSTTRPSSTGPGLR